MISAQTRSRDSEPTLVLIRKPIPTEGDPKNSATMAPINASGVQTLRPLRTKGIAAGRRNKYFRDDALRSSLLTAHQQDGRAMWVAYLAECDEELKKQRRQVRVLTRAVDRERDHANELNSRLHKPALDADDTAGEDTALERANARVTELTTRLRELQSSSSGTRPNTTSSEDTASTRSSQL